MAEIKDRIPRMTIPASASIRQAMMAIDEGALGVALLEDGDGCFAGLVTDGDVRRGLLRGLGLESSVTDLDRPTTRTVGIDATSSALDDLFAAGVRVVPVLDRDDRLTDLAVFDRRVRIPVAEPQLGERELMYTTECILTGWISSAGRFVRDFEQGFAERCGVPFGVATSSGTSALHLALLAAGVGAGDEVVVPALTFVATANAVRYTGAVPVFADSDPETWNIDASTIEKVLTPKVRAIVVVHLYGHPVDLDPVLELAKERDLVVIEDAAQAHGALYKGQPVGGMGAMGTFSFYGNKMITTGEGGMVVTKDRSVSEHVRLLANHGMTPDRRYHHDVLGFNYRMTNLQAAVGLAQLERFEQTVAKKRQLASWYGRELSGCNGLTLPIEAPWAESVHWMYTILLDGATIETRDALLEYLAANEVEARPAFPPLHLQPIYHSASRSALPVAERLGQTGVSLPSGTPLQEADVAHTSELVRGWVCCTVG